MSTQVNYNVLLANFTCTWDYLLFSFFFFSVLNQLTTGIARSLATVITDDRLGVGFQFSWRRFYIAAAAAARSARHLPIALWTDECEGEEKKKQM